MSSKFFTAALLASTLCVVAGATEARDSGKTAGVDARNNRRAGLAFVERDEDRAEAPGVVRSPSAPEAVQSLQIQFLSGGEAQPVLSSSRGSGQIVVGVISTPDFDASSQVDRQSLRFGSTGHEDSLVSCTGGDFNADGLTDLVCRFSRSATAFSGQDMLAHLQGYTVDGNALRGEQGLRVVGDLGRTASAR